MESSRNRMGSASAASTGAACSASRCVSDASVNGAQHIVSFFTFPLTAVLGDTGPPIDRRLYDEHTIQSTTVNLSGGTMSRVQLALNVSDLDAAVEFYSKLFGIAPAKRHPDYANFAIADPPLKLVLIEKADERAGGIAGALNHLGVEVETPEGVATTSARLSGEGLGTSEEIGTTCCYAVQDKVWVE